MVNNHVFFNKKIETQDETEKKRTDALKNAQQKKKIADLALSMNLNKISKPTIVTGTPQSRNNNKQVNVSKGFRPTTAPYAAASQQHFKTTYQNFHKPGMTSGTPKNSEQWNKPLARSSSNGFFTAVPQDRNVLKKQGPIQTDLQLLDQRLDNLRGQIARKTGKEQTGPVILTHKKPIVQHKKKN